MIPRELVITTAILFAVAIGMAIYLSRLRGAQSIPPVQPREPEPVLAPTSNGATEQVSIWVAQDDSGTLRSQRIEVARATGQEHAQEILSRLLKIYTATDSPHHIGAGAEIHDVYLVNPGLAVIDVNSAFADEQTSGVLPEDLTIVSLIESLADNVPGLLRVKFLVDGKERQTLAGHADLTGFYDVSEISEAAKALAQE